MLQNFNIRGGDQMRVIFIGCIFALVAAPALAQTKNSKAKPQTKPQMSYETCLTKLTAQGMGAREVTIKCSNRTAGRGAVSR